MDRIDTKATPLNDIFKDQHNLPKDMSLEHEASHLEDYQAYAVASDDEVVKRLRVFLRNGHRLSIPYSLLPVFILNTEAELIIKAYELLIIIKGRGLARLEEELSLERVVFIRESPSEYDDETNLIFIESITVSGEAITH